MQNPGENQVLLDVRMPAEVKRGTITGALTIPLPELRQKMDTLDEEKEYLVFCQVGLRGHIDTRILINRGFSGRNLTGGYKTYLTATCY